MDLTATLDAECMPADLYEWVGSLDTYHRWLAISLPASLGGLPVISLPISSPSSERTTGIQLMMPAGQDEALLALAESIEPILAA